MWKGVLPSFNQVLAGTVWNTRRDESFAPKAWPKVFWGESFGKKSFILMNSFRSRCILVGVIFFLFYDELKLQNVFGNAGNINHNGKNQNFRKTS